jgi:3-carboxy-cis,cis-muconate cycloisomerase
MDRLDAATERVLVGQYGSAVGTLSSAGSDGLKVRAALMQKLGLHEPDLSWNASRDNYAEVIQTLALVHGTMNRIAIDINLWSRTADNAVNEELSLKVGDVGNREGGISWGCLTPPLLHQRSDMPCRKITLSS